MLMSHRFKELWREPKTSPARGWGRGKATKFPHQLRPLPVSSFGFLETIGASAQDGKW